MSNNKIIKLLHKYQGLRREDLNELNPEYSCIICSNKKCNNINVAKKSCPNQTMVTVSEFVLRYNFKAKLCQTIK